MFSSKWADIPYFIIIDVFFGPKYSIDDGNHSGNLKLKGKLYYPIAAVPVGKA
jgi:hypothetical protein